MNESKIVRTDISLCWDAIREPSVREFVCHEVPEMVNGKFPNEFENAIIKTILLSRHKNCIRLEGKIYDSVRTLTECGLIDHKGIEKVFYCSFFGKNVGDFVDQESIAAWTSDVTCFVSNFSDFIPIEETEEGGIGASFVLNYVILMLERYIQIYPREKDVEKKTNNTIRNLIERFYNIYEDEQVFGHLLSHCIQAKEKNSIDCDRFIKFMASKGIGTKDITYQTDSGHKTGKLSFSNKSVTKDNVDTKKLVLLLNEESKNKEKINDS